MRALSCHKYFTLWLNVTHLWALFPPRLLLLGSLLKNCFDAIQPFISPLPLCNPGAMLCCVFFSSLPKRHITTKNTHTYANYVPVGTGVCPSSVRVEDEQCCYSKPSESKIKIHTLTMTLVRIKEGHTGKTGSIITTQCTLGTVISPGALKD